MIDLDTASRLVDGALEHARAHDMAPMTVAVLDARGCLVAFKMQDGSGLLRPQIAIGKAWGALGMGLGTRALAVRATERPSFFAALAALAPEGRMVPVPGGVLIRLADGELLGAAGASGDLSDNDEACLVAAIEAVGLRADPGDPDG